VLQELGVDDVTTISLAKRMEEVFLVDRAEPLQIPRSSEALYLLQQIRDEAHRFALTYHRLRRGKRMTQSALDGIPGLGETRRKRLLRHFGSVKRIREATREELQAAPGVPTVVADAVWTALHHEGADPSAGSSGDRREAS
jgi:excinuclease ABC subunit C